MGLLARLALRNLLRHPWRSIATVVGVGLGIAAVLATLSVGANVDANVRSTLEAVAGPADLVITPGSTGRAVFEHGGVLEVVRAHPDVAWAVATLNVRAEPERVASGGAQSLLPSVDSGFQLSGRTLERPEALPVAIAEGVLPAAGAREVAIARDFARGRGLRLGDTVSFTTQVGALDFVLVGFLDDRVALASTNGGRIGITSIEVLQHALHFEGRATHLEFALRPGADVDRVRTQLQEAIGEAYTVTYPSGAGDATAGIVQTLQAGLLILAATLMALGGFMAYNTFMAGVVERTREYALLRTICMKRRDVVRLALAEAAWVSAAGVALGLVLGVALAFGITNANAVTLGYEFRTLVLPLPAVLLAAVIGVAVALLAAALPALAASRTAPLAALRGADEAPPRWRTVLGWVLVLVGVGLSQYAWSGYLALFGTALAMGTFFVGIALAADSLIRPAVAIAMPVLRRLFGPSGRLGGGFAGRNSARNGVAIGTVIVGTGLIIGVGSMVAGINRAVETWVDTTIVGDLFVTSPVPFPPSFEADAASVEGVDQVSGVGIRVVRYEPEAVPRGRSVVLVFVDPERFHPETGFGTLQYISGQGDAWGGYRALARGGTVLATNTIRDRFDVGVGDTVRLRTDEGFAEVPVEGIVVDFTAGGETFIASIHDLPRFGGGSPDLFVLTVHPGRDPAVVRESLRAAFPDMLLDVTLNTEYRAAILRLTDQTFATTNTLLVLAAIIAALGVANTLGMNLSRRAHEVAVLRTLGLRRGGVQGMVVAEGLVVLSIGAALGILYGLLLTSAITAGARALTRFQIEPVTPWALIALAAVCTPLVGLVASSFPARRAARLAPRVALGAAHQG